MREKSITPENIEEYNSKDTNYEPNEAINNHTITALTNNDYYHNYSLCKGYNLYQGAYEDDVVKADLQLVAGAFAGAYILCSADGGDAGKVYNAVLENKAHWIFGLFVDYQGHAIHGPHEFAPVNSDG